MEIWRRNLYAVWFTQFLSLMGFGFGLPFLPFFIQELGVTDPDRLKLFTGFLTSGPALALAIMAPIWGIMADRFGKKLMLLRAMFGGTIVLVGLAASQNAYTVLVFRILQGLLTGTVTSSSALVASGTPDKNLSYALGFLSSSTFIGFSLGPAVGGLIAEQFGYRVSFMIGAAIVCIGFMLVIFLIKEPDAAMVGKLPEIKPDEVKPKPESDNKSKLWTGIITPTLIILFVLFFFIRLSRVMPNPFLPLFVQEFRGTIEGSARITGILSGAIGIAAAVSGLTLSRLGDRMNRIKLLGILVAGGAICSSFISIFPGFAVTAVSLVLTYFLIGGVEPLLMSVTSEQVNSEKRGALFGIQTAVGSLAWFCSPLIGSWVSIRFSVNTVFLVFTISLILTFLISIFINLKKR